MTIPTYTAIAAEMGSFGRFAPVIIVKHEGEWFQYRVPGDEWYDEEEFAQDIADKALAGDLSNIANWTRYYGDTNSS